MDGPTPENKRQALERKEHDRVIVELVSLESSSRAFRLRMAGALLASIFVLSDLAVQHVVVLLQAVL